MKTLALLLAAVALLVSSPNMFGQAEIVRERAKELVNQNNVRQGVTPPAAPAAQQTMDPAQAAQLRVTQQIIGKIQADIAAIQKASAVTAEQKQQLLRDLTAAARGTTKPSATTLDKLATDLTNLLPGTSLSSTEQNRLARNLNAMLNSAAIPTAQKQSVLDDVQAILQVAGLTRSKAVSVVGDLKTVAGEVR